MPKIFTSDKQKIGEFGETVAVKFLMKHGFEVLDRNYTRKWGEIDIIAQKDKKLYFIEVKSVSISSLDNVTHETIDSYRAEENMHPWKMQRISRTIQTYLLSKNVPEEVEWQCDLFVVYLDMHKREGRVKVVSNIIL